jgi:hypothetical protein
MKISQTPSAIKLTAKEFTYSFSRSGAKCTGKLNAESFAKITNHMENGSGTYGERLEYIKNNISAFVSTISLHVGDKVFVKPLNETVEVMELNTKCVVIKTKRGLVEAGYNVVC